MLVLTRKVTEKLYIGESICVTVVRLDGGQVRLGIEAPRAIPVVRAELVPYAKDEAPTPARTSEAGGEVDPERQAPWENRQGQAASLKTPLNVPRGTGNRRPAPSR
ncbi:MAG TPA: carbon storage regulator [Isosphaeraceae bacterium]|jgi:carbon storage regulator|nr:carbon storage regulator [Isosphaeraceae bacterium]